MEGIDRVSCYFLARDGLPMHTMEKSDFHQLLKTFDAKYQIPSWRYFSETAIPHLYSSVREKVMEELSSVEYFSGTTDLWSSVGLKPSQFITLNQWQLQSKCLQAHSF